MNAKTIKLLKKFLNYSDAKPEEEKYFINEFKKLNWIERTKQVQHMKQILNGS